MPDQVVARVSGDVINAEEKDRHVQVYVIPLPLLILNLTVYVCVCVCVCVTIRRCWRLHCGDKRGALSRRNQTPPLIGKVVVTTMGICPGLSQTRESEDQVLSTSVP